MKTILVIHGPNLNLLGEREPEIYGHDTLAEINRELEAAAAELGWQTDCRQSNSETEIVSWLQEERRKVAGVILNPAGLSHTSVVLLDAILACQLPVVEVHLSNLYKREEFRQRSLTARGAVGVISGLGKQGYLLALRYLVDSLSK
ncbi:MAG: type II 3-dehydroquinate dehydratase [bacterium]